MAVPSWAQPSGPWHRRQHQRVDESWASPSQPRVERVADGVADEVQSHHGDEQGGTRPEDDPGRLLQVAAARVDHADRKSTRLNSSHSQISYAVFCLKKKKEDSRSRAQARYR